MKNHPALADINSIEVSRLDPELLMYFQEEIATQLALLKRASAALLAGLERRYRDDIKPDVGTQHIEDGDFDVKYELPKRVEWDSDTLRQVSLRAAPYLRRTYDVLESVYKNAPPHIKEELDRARTLKTGTPKFTITRREK